MEEPIRDREKKKISKKISNLFHHLYQLDILI